MRNIALSICSILLVLLLVGAVSAFEFDNKKSTPENFDMYKDTITIENTFLFLFPTGKVADIKLIDNTDQALIKGEATFEVKLYESYNDPITDVEFYDAFSKKRGDVYDITWQWFDDSSYEVEINDYEQSCSLDAKNGTEVCEQVISGTHKETRQHNVWRIYNKDSFEAGTYLFRLTANKPLSSSVDFVPELFGVKLPEFAWWDASWDKKKQINISENSNVDWQNYTVTLNIAYDADMATDFADLRFTNASETAELGYYLVNKTDSTRAVFDVMVIGLAKFTNTTIYMYYDNAAAITTSDGNDAYTFYDNFSYSDSAFDSLGKWSEHRAGGEHYVNYSYMNLSGGAGIYSTFSPNISRGWQLKFDKYITSADANPYQWGFGDGDDSNPAIYYKTPQIGGENKTYIDRDGTQAHFQPSGGGALDTGIWTETIYRVAKLNITSYVDGVLVLHNSTYDLGNNTYTHISFRNAETAQQLRIANVTLRPYANVTPSYIFGVEESNTPPLQVVHNAPATPYSTVYPNVTFNCSALVAQPNTITNLSLFIDDVLNYTQAGTGTNMTNLETIQTFSGVGSHTWFCRTYDDTMEQQNGTLSSISIVPLVENAQTFNATTVETADEGFTINITYDPSTYTFITGTLNYNGTDYAGTSSTSGANTIFKRSVTVPTYAIDSNATIHWKFLLTSEAGLVQFNSTYYNQSVNTINASIYNHPLNITYLNFTVYDEETLVAINTTWSSNIDYGITSLIKNISYQDTAENVTTFAFAFSPPDKDFLVSGTASYSSAGYNSKIYTLPEQTITNATTLIPLYLLNSSDSTSFVVYVRDSSYASVIGAVVYIQRYYPGTNEWKTTEILTTNYEGKSIGHFQTEDVNYRFLVYVNGELLLTTTSTKIFCEVSPCTITLTLPSTTEYATFRNTTNLEYSFTYSTATEIFTYSYNDLDATATGGRLLVVRGSAGNTTITTICDTSSAAASAILTCSIHNLVNGTYTGLAYNNRTTGETHLKTLVITKTRNIVADVGIDGLIWTVFFIMGIVMLGLFKPAAAILFGIFGVVFVSLLGLASIPFISVVALILMGLILWWGMRST